MTGVPDWALAAHASRQLSLKLVLEVLTIGANFLTRTATGKWR